MKIAFYKVFSFHGTWKEILLDIVIGITTLGRYSHVELVFSDGECFSISPRGKIGRFKNIELYSDRWEVIDLSITTLEEAELKSYTSLFVGMEYDYVGAVFSATPICIQQSNKIFCSEVVVNILVQIAIFSNLGDGCKYSPSRLHEEVIKLLSREV